MTFMLVISWTNTGLGTRDLITITGLNHLKIFVDEKTRELGGHNGVGGIHKKRLRSMSDL